MMTTHSCEISIDMHIILCIVLYTVAYSPFIGGLGFDSQRLSRQEVFLKHNQLSSCADEGTLALDQPLPFYPDVAGYQVSSISFGKSVQSCIPTLI